MNAYIGAATMIMKWSTWNISLSDRYLTNPLPGRKERLPGIAPDSDWLSLLSADVRAADRKSVERTPTTDTLNSVFLRNVFSTALAFGSCGSG